MHSVLTGAGKSDNTDDRTTMSFNTAMGTITVDGVTYDVETHSTNLGQRLTIQFEGEDMFEGLEGLVENEEYVEEHHNPRDACNVGTMAISYRGYNLGGSDDDDISQIEFVKPCPVCNDPINWVVGVHRTAERLAVGSQEEAQAFLNALPDVQSGNYYIEPIVGEPGYVRWDGDPGHFRYEDNTMTCPECGGEGELPESPVDYFRRERGARVVVGLTVYEHSGITMRAGDVTLPWDSDRWDTSFVGFIFDTPEQLQQTMGDKVTDEEIEAALREEVKLYASYLEGDVCWFRVEDEESGFYESCGGFVGCQDECERECYTTLEYAITKRIREDEERLYWHNREVLTV
jgi:hypothetical protein